MAYTFGQLKKIVEHVLGSAPDSRISRGFIVNEAVQFLFDAYAWSWKIRSATLDAVAGSEELALPAGFGGLILIRFGSSTSGYNLHSADPDWSNRNLLGLTGSYKLVGVRPSAADPTKWAAMIRPVPTAAATAAFYLVYQAEPVRLQEDDSVVTAPVSPATTPAYDDAKVIPIPSSAQPALLAICRAKAMSLEVDPNTPEWQQAETAVKMAIAKDQRMGGHSIGKLNGLHERHYPPHMVGPIDLLTGDE